MENNHKTLVVTTPDGQTIPGLPPLDASSRQSRQMKARGITHKPMRSGTMVRKHRNDRLSDLGGMPNATVRRFTGRNVVAINLHNFPGNVSRVLKFYSNGDEPDLDALTSDQLPDNVKSLIHDTAEVFCTVLALDEVAEASEWFSRDFVSQLTASHRATGKFDFGSWYVLPTDEHVLAAIKAAKDVPAPTVQAQTSNVVAVAPKAEAPHRGYEDPEGELDEHQLVAMRNG